MSDGDIAPEIRDLLRQCIHTYERLDTLLLLWRTPIGLELADVATRLELTPRTAREVLSQLVAAELVVEEQPGHYRYRPGRPELRAAVEGLARLFEDDPIRVVQWMSRNAFDRLYHSAATAIAEALWTGKKKGE